MKVLEKNLLFQLRALITVCMHFSTLIEEAGVPTALYSSNGNIFTPSGTGIALLIQ
jgi:hypothetical protein